MTDRQLPVFHVTVFCSSASVEAIYFDAARQLGAALANKQWTLVYGGNRPGPMGAMADACRQAGGRVVGVTPNLFGGGGQFGDVIDRDCDELILVDTMRQRKAAMEERGHAFITLPGGIGTLEEFFEILVGRHLRQHDKPVILLNIAGFYQPLIDWLRRGTESGFVRPAVWEQLHLANTIDDAIALLGPFAAQHRSEGATNLSPR